MPKYVNSFKSPDYFEETILDGKRNTIGTIRVKPSSVLWKPSGARGWLYKVSLDKFVEWISSKASGATKVKR